MTWETASAFLYHWQTLISAGLAVLAALGTIWVINRQTLAAQKRHEDAMERKRLAVRAQLHDALSQMARYLKQVTEFVEERSEDHLYSPDAALATLKSGIEFVDTPAAKDMIELLSQYQIHSSRLSDPAHYDDVEGLYTIANMMRMTNRLFYYARGEEYPGITEQEAMVSALRNCVGLERYVRRENQYAPVVAMIERRHPE